MKAGVFTTPAERAILHKMNRIHAVAEERTSSGPARDFGFFDYTEAELAELAELNRLRKEEGNEP